jgi:hypothetical protein
MKERLLGVSGWIEFVMVPILIVGFLVLVECLCKEKRLDPRTALPLPAARTVYIDTAASLLNLKAISEGD